MTVEINFDKDHAIESNNLRVIGPNKFVTGSITFDDSYPTNGEELDLSNYMRQTFDVFIPPVSGYLFEYDPDNDKVIVYEGNSFAPSGTVTQPDFTGEALDDVDFNVMDDDSAASNGTPVYIALDRAKTQEAMLWSEMENESTVEVETASGSLEIPVIHKLTENSTIKVIDDDSADSNGTALYAVLTGERTPWGAAIAVLQSATAGNADSDFDVADPSDTFTVFDNDNAATAGIAGLSTALQVYLDEDVTDVADRLLVNNADTGSLAGLDVYVRSNNGRYLKLKHDSSADSNGVAVYFDDDAATETDRLLFISPTNSNMTDGEIGHRDGVYAVDGVFLAFVYFDDDGANEDERLLWINPSEVDAFASLLSDNRLLKLVHDASADSNGAQLYIDDDAAAADERFISINAGDADSTVQLSPDYKYHGDIANGTVSQPTFSGDSATQFAEVSNEDDLSALDDVPFIAWGY